MRRLLYSLPLLLLLSLPAWAACSVTSVQVKDNAGATPSYGAVNDGTNCAGETALVAGGALIAAANPLPVGPGTNSLGVANANVTSPFAVQLMVSDNTNLERLLAPIILGDGVNGNNMVSDGLWGWNGASWDRIRTDTTAGLWTQLKAALPTGTNSIGQVTANAGTNLNTSSLALESGGNLATLAGGVTASVYQENVKQINGVTPLMGNGVTGTGSQRVTIASDNTAVAAAGQVATGAAPPTGSTYVGTLQSGATGGHVGGIIQCDNHVFKHITTATDTNAVTGVASQAIYICSWRSRAAGVATWFLESSNNTSGTCGTPTQLTGVATEAANTGETWGTAFWSGLKVATANGLCINSTGTGGVDVDIWYTQF